MEKIFDEDISELVTVDMTWQLFLRVHIIADMTYSRWSAEFSFIIKLCMI